MAHETIDIGATASDRNSTIGIYTYTCINRNNAANATGLLDVFEFYFSSGALNATGVIAGTFSGSTTTWDDRDYESIGNVTKGSKQTFTGKNCDVTSGDMLGYYVGNMGYLEAADSGGGGVAYISGSKFGAGNTSGYSVYANYIGSIYATGYNAPDAPTNVAATDNLPDKVTVTWTQPAGTFGNVVYRDGSDLSGLIAATTSYDDTTATLGTTYAYTVYALNNAGASPASSADNGIRRLICSKIGHKSIPSFLGGN